MTKYFDEVITSVLMKKVVRRRGVQPCTRYLIKWKELQESDALWETLKDFWQIKGIIQ
ncbi:hypothetical protein KSP40_PGU002327 [Platanthera guangdongensis]|uniref:Chromo domain-containing protein n=1 Tax=Platanthera guangdongensis TaxID=2320717 RepID=A0ABR2MPJ4_9ASPA